MKCEHRVGRHRARSATRRSAAPLRQLARLAGGDGQSANVVAKFLKRRGDVDFALGKELQHVALQGVRPRHTESRCHKPDHLLSRTLDPKFFPVTYSRVLVDGDR